MTDRVAPPQGMLFEPQELPRSGPARAKGGAPYVRWGRLGEHQGWYAIGSRPPRLARTPNFWEAVFAGACSATGNRVDQVHCCGSGILALGGLGVTLRSGYGQLLLHECYLLHPEQYMAVMAPALYGAGVYTRRTKKSESGVAFARVDGSAVVDEKALRMVVTLGSDSRRWSGRQKAHAFEWVECCSRLLRDERMDAAQAKFAVQVMPSFVDVPTRRRMRWPQSGPGAIWEYSREARLLWALVFVLALADETATAALVEATTAGEPWDAAASVRRMREVIAEERFAESFQTRFVDAMTALTALFGVEQAMVQ